MELTVQITSLIQNIVLIVTGIIGSILAIKGYGAWKKQLKGKDLYSVQKSLMGGLIDYRNALNHVRNPFLQYSKEEGESDEDATVRVYNQRLNVLHNARRDLELAIRELSIIKGTDHESAFDGIWEWYASTVVAIESYFEDKGRGSYIGELSDEEKKFRREQREIMFSKSNNDVIMEPFLKKMNELEEYIRKLI